MEALIPETLSWAPPMAVILRSKCQARSQEKTRGQDEGRRQGVGCALHVQPGWHYHPCRWQPEEKALSARRLTPAEVPSEFILSEHSSPLAAECETRWTKQLDGKYILTPTPFFLSGNINLVTDNKTIFNAFVQRTCSSTDDLQWVSQITFSCKSHLPLPSALIHCCPWQL